MVGGADYFLPLRRRELVARENLAHFVIQNFGCGARQRVQPVIAKHQKIVAQRHAGQFDAVDDFHRRERVNVHLRHRAFYGAQNVAIIIRRQTVRQAALDANLGRAQVRRFFGFARHVFERMKIRIGFARTAAEGTEFASDETHVREIDIAIHDVADDVADQVAAERIGGHQQGDQVGAAAIRQSVPLFVFETCSVLLFQHSFEGAPNR